MLVTVEVGRERVGEGSESSCFIQGIVRANPLYTWFADMEGGEMFKCFNLYQRLIDSHNENNEPSAS